MSLEKLLEQIDAIEQSLRDELEVLISKAEEHTDRFDDYTEDENGEKVGVLYPENVAPDLDMAIHHLSEAWSSLKTHTKELP